MGSWDPGRRGLAAAGLMTAVLLLGTIGYLVLGLSVLDAVYQTAITVTTVGFAEVTPEAGEPSVPYRLFTLGLVLTGAFAVLFAAGVVIESMLETRMGVFQERRMQKEIDALKGHVIVCGFGRVGNAVVRRANGLGGKLVIIDADEDRLRDCTHLHIVGDATSDEVLVRAGVMRAEAIVAALPSDAGNLFLAVSVRQLNDAVRIVSRANASDSAQKLRTFSLDTVVEPYEMAGARLATAALRPHTSAYLDQVFSTESDKVELTEVMIQEGSTLVGAEHISTETSTGVIIVAIRPHGEHEFVSAAAHNSDFVAGDVMIVLGDRDGVTRIMAMARG